MVKRKKEVKKVEEKPVLSKKEQDKKHGKILKLVLIGMAVLIVFIVVLVFSIRATKTFEVEGVDFEIVKSGNLVLYNTKLPVVIGGEDREYNFYLRTDPRKLLEEVPFEGDIQLASVLALNSTSDFNCDGFGIIAIANLANLYRISGIEVIRDDNAHCDPLGRYAFINIQEGNETKIVKVGEACYEVHVNNCQILEATERLMLESFIEINKQLD